MAFYNDDDDENQQDPNAPTNQGGVATGTESAVISGQGSAPQAGGAPKAGAPDRGSKFVGLKQYLDANKRQSENLGTQVAGNIDNSIKGASDEISGVGAKFNQRADQGTISNLNTAADDAKNAVYQAAWGAAGTGPNQNQVNRFKEVSTAQYKGPKSIQDTSDLYQSTLGAIQGAQKKADLTKTEEGRQQLLRDQFKDPSYTAGANRFDAYLMNNANTQQKLAQSRQNAGALQGQFDQAGANAARYAQDLASKTDAARAAAQQELQKSRAGRAAAVEQGLEAQRAGWKSEYDLLINALNSAGQGATKAGSTPISSSIDQKFFGGNVQAAGGADLSLNDQQLARLGVNAGDQFFNLLNGSNAGDYVNMQEFDANRVISRDEQAQLAALDMLANQFGGEQTNKYTMADLAGTLNKDKALDASKFGKSVKEVNNLLYGSQNLAKDASDLDILRNRINSGVGSMEDLAKETTRFDELQKYLQGLGYGNQINRQKSKTLGAAPEARTGKRG